MATKCFHCGLPKIKYWVYIIRKQILFNKMLRNQSKKQQTNVVIFVPLRFTKSRPMIVGFYYQIC
jgi:hypothetical protein